MRTKSKKLKPSEDWGKPSATVANALKQAPKSRPKPAKGGKTKTTPASPPKKADFGAWHKFSVCKPGIGAVVVLGRIDKELGGRVAERLHVFDGELPYGYTLWLTFPPLPKL